MILTVLMSKWIAGPRPFTAFMQALPMRLLGVVAYVGLFLAFPAASPSAGILTGFLVVTALYRVPCQICFISQMAFFAKVSDPGIGGTYMTLLNTLSNLGNQLASQVALRSIDYIGMRIPSTEVVDGFVIVAALSVVIGLVWLLFAWPIAKRLESAPASEWLAR
jgi:PAT family acetyl-CoA transporter-like MFS transporter 1